MANAVLDGVDCIMLGAETLRGKHPVATVETILHICKQAEKVFDHDYHFETLMRVRPAAPLLCCLASHQLSYVFCLWEKRTEETFWHQFGDKASVITDCPGVYETHQECQSNMTGKSTYTEHSMFKIRFGNRPPNVLHW